jgi:hypothetical protein
VIPWDLEEGELTVDSRRLNGVGANWEGDSPMTDFAGSFLDTEIAKSTEKGREREKRGDGDGLKGVGRAGIGNSSRVLDYCQGTVLNVKDSNSDKIKGVGGRVCEKIGSLVRRVGRQSPGRSASATGIGSFFLRGWCILFRPHHGQYQCYPNPNGHFREPMKCDRPCRGRPRDQ